MRSEICVIGLIEIASFDRFGPNNRLIHGNTRRGSRSTEIGLFLNLELADSASDGMVPQL